MLCDQSIDRSAGLLLTCRLSGCRRRRRRTSAALLRTDPPRSSPAGDSDLPGNSTDKKTTNHSQTWRVQTGSERFSFQAACVFTELFTDDGLCVGVVLPAQDGSY